MKKTLNDLTTKEIESQLESVRAVRKSTQEHVDYSINFIKELNSEIVNMLGELGYRKKANAQDL